jgi:hypothetical protein
MAPKADPKAAVSALVWYPTQAQSQAHRIGPFSLEVAADAAPSSGRQPLLLLSHVAPACAPACAHVTLGLLGGTGQRARLVVVDV